MSSSKTLLLLALVAWLCFEFAGCQNETNERCDEENKRECVSQNGSLAFRQCRSQYWQDGSCAHGQICVSGDCKEKRLCTQKASRCLDDKRLEHCELEQIPRIEECLQGQLCRSGHCVEEKQLSKDQCPALGKKSPEELQLEYLRQDAHCGTCNQACDTALGQHCVLGQCVKTRCDESECHQLEGQRYVCVPCPTSCQAPFVTHIYRIPQSSHMLTAENTSPEAYLHNGTWQYRQSHGCACRQSDGNTSSVCNESSNNCQNGRCVCGEEKKPCPSGVACIDGRCADN